MKREPLSPADAAWYHFDGPVNTAVITSAVLTAAPLDFERVRRVYASRLARFARFSRRVVERRLRRPCWEAMPGFEIGQQLHHVALPAPGGEAALAKFIADLASTPLDHARPLWDVHVVDGVNGGSALVTRIHHCMGDGTANVLVAQTLYDTAADAPLERPAPPVRPARGARARLAPVIEAMVRPQATVRRAATQAAVALAGAGMLAGELLRRSDPRSPLKGEFGLAKRLAWSAPIALSDVRAIGTPLGAKINDVLVAAVTGALRHYLRGRGMDVNRMGLRAMVPVDLRPPGHAEALGNAFGLVLLDLPVRSRDPLQRVRATKAKMDALKRSPEPVAALALIGLLGYVPKVVEDLAVRLFERKASVVMTNVAGPKEPLYLAGTPIERVMFWVPHPGEELGMGISILSYCGAATLSVIADARLVPDPQAITAQFQREFDALLAAVRKRGVATAVSTRRPRAPVRTPAPGRKPAASVRAKRPAATTPRAPAQAARRTTAKAAARRSGATGTRSGVASP